MTTSGGDIDQRLIKVLAHPLRLRIHRILSEQVASPAQMAGLTEEALPNVAYHTRVLLDHGCIELVDTQPRRGAVEHFYRARNSFQGRKGSSLSWQPLLVDEAGWKEVLRILEEGEERLRQVGKECAKRIEDPKEGIPIVVAHSAFETREGKERS